MAARKRCTVTPLVVGNTVDATTSRSENPTLFVLRRVDRCSQQCQHTIQFLLVAVSRNMLGKRPSRRSNVRTMRKSSRPVSRQLILDRRCTAVVKRASRRSQVRRVHSNGPSASPCSHTKQRMRTGGAAMRAVCGDHVAMWTWSSRKRTGQFRNKTTFLEEDGGFVPWETRRNKGHTTSTSCASSVRREVGKLNVQTWGGRPSIWYLLCPCAARGLPNENE